jgi:hypothetical protein
MMSELGQGKKPRWQDPIVAEVQAARQDLLAKVNYDLHTLCEFLRSHQEAEGRKPVTRKPRPADSPKSA